MEIKAYAKINIALNVVGKRDDGYHELEMIMVPIDLYDTLIIEKAAQDQYTCDDESIIMNGDNTIVKAVELMRTTFDIKDHFHIHIKKRIPAQAGLAGGSADGAAVLKGIRSLCQMNITLEDLAQLGKKIGADVPFCVIQKPAIVKGIGEKIEPFPIHCDFDILLVKPQAGVSTGKAFSMLDFSACDHPDCEQVKDCLMRDQFQELANQISNSLEYSAFQLVPEISTLKQELQRLGFPIVLMSGSGSCVFALTRDIKLLEETMSDLRKQEYFVYHTHIL